MKSAYVRPLFSSYVTVFEVFDTISTYSCLPSFLLSTICFQVFVFTVCVAFSHQHLNVFLVPRLLFSKSIADRAVLFLFIYTLFLPKMISAVQGGTWLKETIEKGEHMEKTFENHWLLLH